jgi:gluconokinase
MPDSFRSVRHWMSLGEYIYLQILGVTAAGTSTAAWTGMLDRRTGQWDQELLDVCGVRDEQLSEVRDPDQPITEVDAAVRRRWPALAGAAWFPVVSDGFSSNMGAGAFDESVVAASVATSGAMRVLVHGIPEEIPSGLWCYRVDGSRSLLGGAVNDVGRVVSWLQSTVRFLPEDDFNLILAARRRPAPRLYCLTSPESAARDGRPTRGQCSREFPQPRRAQCFPAEPWKASRSRTPGSPNNCNRWPVNRNGSWQAAG